MSPEVISAIGQLGIASLLVILLIVIVYRLPDIITAIRKRRDSEPPRQAAPVTEREDTGKIELEVQENTRQMADVLLGRRGQQGRFEVLIGKILEVQQQLLEEMRATRREAAEHAKAEDEIHIKQIDAIMELTAELRTGANARARIV